MSRKANEYKTNHIVQRQTSVKSDDAYQPERLTFLKTGTVVPWYAGFEPRKPADRPSPNSPLSENKCKQVELYRPKEQSAAKFLATADQGHCGTPTMATNQVSQQPSFESYDSSISANDWPSSNEPDGPASPYSTMHEEDKKIYAGYTKREIVGENFSPKFSEKIIRWAPQHEILPIQSNTTVKQSTPNEPGTPDSNSLQSNREEMRTDQSSKGEDMSTRIKINPKKLSLRLLSTDQTFEEKGSQNRGQNIKGMWKRAFQSMLKDKVKREKPVADTIEPAPISDEVDPIYHLLRCAASKSQISNLAGSSVNKDGEIRRRPSTPDTSKPDEETPSASTIKSNLGYEHKDGHQDNLTEHNQPAIRIRMPLLKTEDDDISCKADFDVKESMYAYELPHRTAGRPGMLHHSQKNLSISTNSSMSFKSSPNCTDELYNKPFFASSHYPASINATGSPLPARRTTKLSNRLKSLSVDDAPDSYHNDRIMSQGISPRSDSLELQFAVPHQRRLGSETRQSVFQEHQNYLREGSSKRVKLLSMKSVSLDVPVIESSEGVMSISGGSSPGQHTTSSRWHQFVQPANRRKQDRIIQPTSPVEIRPDTTIQYDQRFTRTTHKLQPAAYRRHERNAGIRETNFMEESCRPHVVEDQAYIAGRMKASNFSTPSKAQRYRKNFCNQHETKPSGGVYLVIQDYLPRRSDELLLRSGQYVRVLDNSDPFWWYGTSDGRAGYFPTKTIQD